MIYLSIGSNLNSIFGDRFQNIKKAIEFLKFEKIKINKISSFYETPSYPNKNYPKFINIAILVESDIKPKKLLNKILLIEKKMQRIRTLKNEPRTCDIDIIDFGGLSIYSEELKLPHPKLHERNFVLYPLIEIAPSWVHPLNNKKIDNLIKNLSHNSRNEITRLKESDILDK